MRYIAPGLLSLVLFAATANAKWLEASSDHFIIYADQDAKQVQRFAERLERFHAAMAHVFQTKHPNPSPSNRVTIFVVSDAAEVRAVTGAKDKYLTGIYLPRAGASIAVVPKLKKTSSKYELSGETVLYHEYAHHFMHAGLTRRALPRWFVEGFAEFFAGVQFKVNGNVILGAPVNFRAPELFYARKVPIRTLLDFEGGSNDNGFNAFYGQSWLLFHYLQMEPERAGQLPRYHQLLSTGRSALEAAEDAFGDLDQLAKDMESYVKRRTMSVLMIESPALSIGPITLRELRAGEAAMMPIIIESRVGVSAEEAATLVPEARKVAERYPDDANVLAALAEAELDAGNEDAAIAAAERALAIDPKQINAHIQKGYALAHKVHSGALPEDAWKDVRTQFVKANQAENDHPIPLVQFYLSYLGQGKQPTKNAIEGLEWAMELAPFDASLRWLVAQQMVSDERFKEAAQTLAPLAYSPHPGEHTVMAKQLLKDVEARLEASEAHSAASHSAD
jgi:cytochrome c-type biogenesis protein CcmH/NrfG